MLDILEKNELREIDIINCLYNEAKWWSVHDLAKKTNHGVQAIYQAINSLNLLFKETEQPFTIETQKTKGVYLHTPPNYAILQIESIILYNSLSYKLMNAILTTKNLSIQKLADDLFVSKSTIYRRIRAINTILKLSKMEINSKTLELTGPEASIRHLMINIYWPVKEHITWQFPSINQEIIYHRMTTNLKEVSAHLNGGELLKLAYMLAITFIRHQGKHFITTLPVSDYINEEKTVAIEGYLEFFDKIVPEAYLMNELKYITTFSCLESYYSSSEEKIATINTFHQTNNTLPYQVYLLFEKKFSQIYPNTPVSTSPMTQFQLMEIFIYAILYSDYKHNKEYILRYNFELIVKQQPLFSKNLSNILTDLAENSLVKDQLIDAKILTYYTHLMLMAYMDLELLEQTISVLILCAENRANETSVKNELIKRSNFNLLVYTSSTMTTEISNYDLLINDFDLSERHDLVAKAHCRLLFPPTIRDWDYILTLLKELNHHLKE